MPVRRSAAKATAPAPEVAPDFWYVYLVRCADGSLYTGVARNVRTRVAAHNAGRGARYTRARGPVRLEKTRRCSSQGQALSLEYAVKQLSRVQKERLLIGRGLTTFALRVARAKAHPKDTEPRS
jgi:putative endonuclease